ncbi:MAG: Rpn family recombination-promoting nuclease/putative transposase [Cyanobacteria bacterium J06626_18]
MRRGSIFYRLFQQYPALLFALLPASPANAANYTFDSVAVKEPRFEIDGVFLPPKTDPSGTVFFCEVQFQKDEKLYERLFAESLLYFYRNREQFSDWQAVVIYPTRSIEQNDVYPHRSLLGGEQVHRIYLDELGDIRQLPITLALLVLTTIGPEQADEEARQLLAKGATGEPSFSDQGLIDVVITIMMYRYEGSSRREIEQMLGISIKESRAYREIKQEGREEGREEGERSLILLQITHRFGEVSQVERDRIEALSPKDLENLGKALFDFDELADLQAWLEGIEE